MYLVGGEAAAMLTVVVATAWCAARLMRGLDRRRVSLESSLILYFGAVVTVTLFPVAVGFGRGEVGLNIVPTRSLLSIAAVGPGQITRQILGNMLMFVPFGLLAPALWARGRSWCRMIALAVFVSVGIELTQYVQVVIGLARWRAVDVDDVLLNVTGALVGYAAWLVARALTNKRFNPTRRSASPLRGVS